MTTEAKKWVRVHAVLTAVTIALMGACTVLVGLFVEVPAMLIPLAALYVVGAFNVAKVRELIADDFSVSSANVREIKQVLNVAQRQIQERFDPREPWQH